MKISSVNGLRGKQLSLAFIIFCTTVLIWGWERAPNHATLLPPHEDLYTQAAHMKYIHEQKADEAQDNQARMSRDTGGNNEQKADEAQESQARMSRDIGGYNEQKADEAQENQSHGDTGGDNEQKADETQENKAQMSGDTGGGNEQKANEAQENQAQMSRVTGCNYGRGRWVEDEKRSLYSGFECKQWLSESWSCRLTQRTDFTYEKYRWQPEDCNLPEFDGVEFLTRMQDKTLALVGDSLGRQQFQSLMCMVTGGKGRPDVEDVGQEYGFITGDERPSGWAYRFPETNTTILYYWSATLCELEPLNVSDPTTMFAMHLDRPTGFLTQNLHRFDVVVLNTGHHWNRPKFTSNRWIMYANGLPVTDMKLARMDRAKNLTVYTVVRWLDAQLPLYPRLKVFFRSISPRHFFNGEWNTGGTCDNTRPLSGGNAVPFVATGDPLVMGAVSGTQVKNLDITDLSQLRDEGHISRFGLRGAKGVQDCLHWCLPGIPDTWNEILAAQI